MSVRLNIDESVLDYRKVKLVVEVNGNTVGECLDYIVKRRSTLKKAIFDENGKMRLDNLVRVNGESIYSDALTKSVKDGDEIEIIKFTGE